MYIVTRAFFDLTADNRLYKEGDQYPAAGEKPSKARIKSLLKGTNDNGHIYLKEVPEEKPVVPEEEPEATVKD